MKLILLFCIICLPGCTLLSSNEVFYEVKPMVEKKDTPDLNNTPLPPSPINLYVEEEEEKPAKNTGEILEGALQEARQKPEKARFFNSITYYDFIPGSLYQIYTAPLKVTMVSFEVGEKMVSAPQGGDTARWQINTITSGKGQEKQQHLIIKPLRPGLKNNVIITTDKGRTYLLELTSFTRSYMAAVAWYYPKSDLNTATQQTTNSNKRQWASDPLNFNYRIKTIQGHPDWKPTAVFDDGKKTFIQFAPSINQTELPILYIVTRETNNQLVNYRYRGNCMVVDRLFQQAELRLGRHRPEIVRIKKG